MSTYNESKNESKNGNGSPTTAPVVVVTMAEKASQERAAFQAKQAKEAHEARMRLSAIKADGAALVLSTVGEVFTAFKPLLVAHAASACAGVVRESKRCEHLASLEMALATAMASGEMTVEEFEARLSALERLKVKSVTARVTETVTETVKETDTELN